jgi:hypothetical protein
MARPKGSKNKVKQEDNRELVIKFRCSREFNDLLERIINNSMYNRWSGKSKSHVIRQFICNGMLYNAMPADFDQIRELMDKEKYD